MIGKDIPFQFVYQRRFGQPLFSKNVVLAHDVDDFSKIWQAMGRSRTMNETRFSVYKSDIPEEALAEQAGLGLQDIKAQTFTRHLYVHNCDSKMAGNLSSIYQVGCRVAVGLALLLDGRNSLSFCCGVNHICGQRLTSHVLLCPTCRLC